MRRIVFLLNFSIILFSLHAQKTEIGFRTGYSFFKMERMHQSLNYEILQLPFQASLMSEYPSWISFGGYVRQKINKMYLVGLNYNFNSTGSRIYYSDYSGEYIDDESLVCHSLGISNLLKIIRIDNIRLFADLEGGMNFSSLTEQKSVTIFGSTNTESVKKHLSSWYLQPGIMLSWSNKYYKISADAGYHYDLTDPGDTTLLTNWSGFRMGLEAGIFIDRILKKNFETTSSVQTRKLKNITILDTCSFCRKLLEEPGFYEQSSKARDNYDHYCAFTSEKYYTDEFQPGIAGYHKYTEITEHDKCTGEIRGYYKDRRKGKIRGVFAVGQDSLKVFTVTDIPPYYDQEKLLKAKIDNRYLRLARIKFVLDTSTVSLRVFINEEGEPYKVIVNSIIPEKSIPEELDKYLLLFYHEILFRPARLAGNPVRYVLDDYIAF